MREELFVIVLFTYERMNKGEKILYMIKVKAHTHTNEAGCEQYRNILRCTYKWRRRRRR